MSATPPHPTPEQPAPVERTFELERIVFFSDAVFAIAITLLALEIRLPEAAGLDFLPLMGDLGGKLFSYILSFLVIGIYWVFHHRIFRHIEHYDRGLIWLNLVFLMCIAFIPVPSGLLGEQNTGAHGPVVLYAVTMTITGVVSTLLWRHAVSARLIDSRVSRAMIRRITIGAAGTAVIFLPSIPLAYFLGPEIAQYSWALTGLFVVLLNRLRPLDQDWRQG